MHPCIHSYIATTEYISHEPPSACNVLQNIGISFYEMLTSFSSVLTLFVEMHLELWSPVPADRARFLPRRQHRAQLLAALPLLLPSQKVALVTCSAFDDSLFAKNLR